jgi:hypothetical protein
MSFDAYLFDAGGVLVLPDPTVLAPLLAVFVLLALLVGQGTAQATFPGENGKIAFQWGGVIGAVNPDGSAETFLTCHSEVMGRAQPRGAHSWPVWSPDGRR